MLFQFTDGVVIVGNKYINAILRAASIAYSEQGLDECWITSALEGEHGTGSYHPQGRALDLRFWNIKPENRRIVAARLRNLLPSYYDVVMEADHFHVEADAKKEFGQAA